MKVRRGLRCNPHRSTVNEREKLAKKFSPVNSFQMNRVQLGWKFPRRHLPSLVHKADLQKLWVFESKGTHAGGKGTFEERSLSAGAAAAGEPLAKPLSCRKRRWDGQGGGERAGLGIAGGSTLAGGGECSWHARGCVCP